MSPTGFLASLRDICLFRRGPEDMPYAPGLLVALLVASAVLAALYDLRLRGVAAATVVASVVGTLATLGVLYELLRWRGKRERFVQAALALTATSFLFQLVAMPLLLVIPIAAPGAAPLKPEDVTGWQMLAAFVMLLVAIWQACISVSILRRALEVPVAGGVLALLALACTNFAVAALGSWLGGVA